MKYLIGSPGKVSGLVLRMGQCLFAAASLALMASASGFTTATSFCIIKTETITDYWQVDEQQVVPLPLLIVFLYIGFGFGYVLSGILILCFVELFISYI
ncbi:hypothetical protein HanLR1_Chr07g0255771 [Helianthus annuus]|nr:hypothetical protein HanLR1_Chr07g0255771 [Helianthus annuus]